MVVQAARSLVAGVLAVCVLDAAAVVALGAVPQERRVALVVGNNAYPQMPLQNAVNDARAVDRALTAAGFATELVLDATLRQFDVAVERFLTRLQPGDVAMFYYSGHGIQVASENYLIPVDFKAREEVDAKYDSVPAGRIVDRMSASGARLNIVVLDACRNNPFRSTRSGTRGLALMDSGRGTLIAFATAPNQTADDNPTGTNGLFTSHMLEAMSQPGLGVEQVFSRARQRVYEASKGRQVPWLVSSVIGDFAFVGAGSGSRGLPPATTSFLVPEDPRIAIPDLLARYRRAYETMDVGALMRVFPAFPAREDLEKRFADLKGVALALGQPAITVASDTTAKATLDYTLVFTPKNGRAGPTRRQLAEFTFERQNGEWLIKSVTFR
jgi:hypothetical protein